MLENKEKAGLCLGRVLFDSSSGNQHCDDYADGDYDYCDDYGSAPDAWWVSRSRSALMAA